jgi:hypothetical protein
MHLFWARLTWAIAGDILIYKQKVEVKSAFWRVAASEGFCFLACSLCFAAAARVLCPQEEWEMIGLGAVLGLARIPVRLEVKAPVVRRVRVFTAGVCFCVPPVE